MGDDPGNKWKKVVVVYFKVLSHCARRVWRNQNILRWPRSGFERGNLCKWVIHIIAPLSC